MGYGSFFNVRTDIAKLYDEEFGTSYQNYIHECILATSTDELRELDKEFEDYVNSKNIPENLLDFLLASDECGKVDYKTSKLLRDLCWKSTDTYQYGYWYNRRTLKEIGDIFNDSYKNRCQAKWR